MFRKLSTKLTVMYGGVFSLVLLILVAACYFAVIAYARSSVQNEMSASTSVFSKLWALKSEALETNAALLSSDFGFKSALASGDMPTVDSAFENLKARVKADEGIIISADGQTLSTAKSVLGPDMARLMTDAYSYDPLTGIVTVDGSAFSTVAAPILAPDPIGWIVFADRLDAQEMQALQSLSSIKLDASILTRLPDGQWQDTSGDNAIMSSEGVSRFIEGQISKSRAEIIRTPRGQLIAVATPLPALDKKQPSVLVLSYPLGAALAAYQPLLSLMIVLGILALAVIVVASLYLARSITKPMQALQSAANRLKAGVTELVAVETKDEMGDLASAFNAMAVSIKDRERDILHLARHDVTTGLPNRVAFEDYLTQTNELPLVFAIGIERFSHIRAVWGVEAANGVVSAMAEVLQATCQGVFIARLSAATMVISLPQQLATTTTDFAPVLSQVLDSRFTVGEQLIDITVTIGFDADNCGDRSGSERIERALIALDQARAMKAKFSAFNPKTYEELADNLLLTEHLRQALHREELEVFYQPKYNYRTQTITSAEALVRWTHADRGPVSPQRFVLIAEETGYIRQLTHQVLVRTIRDQAALKLTGQEIEISVNYSGRLLSDDEFTEKTLRLCEQAQGKICLEITETAVIEDPEIGLASIKRFVAAGIDISIDDFGTGLSSLSYLKLIPAQELKIDRSFVMEMEKTHRDALLVRATIDMAHGLGMKVTAEGVEDQSTIAALSLMGCDMAQGYGIARPMPIKAFSEFLIDFARENTPVSPSSARDTG